MPHRRSSSRYRACNSGAVACGARRCERMPERQPRAAGEHSLHRYFIRAFGCERERHKLQVLVPLAGPGFGAPVVEGEPIDFTQASDERREILNAKEALLAFEAPGDEQHMAGEQLELVQQDVVRRREVADEQRTVVVAEWIAGRRDMARLVLAREARYRAQDEPDAIAVEEDGLSLDRLQCTVCQGTPHCILDDGQRKHAVILDPFRATVNDHVGPSGMTDLPVKPLPCDPRNTQPGASVPARRPACRREPPSSRRCGWHGRCARTRLRTRARRPSCRRPPCGGRTG